MSEFEDKLALECEQQAALLEAKADLLRNVVKILRGKS